MSAIGVGVRLLALLMPVCVAVILGTSSPAAAHAALRTASPAAGEQLAVAPEEVRLEFNEEVDAGPDSLRVFDEAGVRIDEGAIDTGSSDVIAVALPANLGDAGYVVAYRVTSVDAHPIAGTTTFIVGNAPTLDAATVEAIAGPSAGWVGGLGSALRGIGYAATLLAAGAIGFVLAVARTASDRETAGRIARPAAVVGVVATLLHIPLQAAAISGYGLLEAMTDGAIVTATLTSSFGQATLLRAVGLALLWALWRRHAPNWALAAVSAVTLGSYLLDGHQRSIEPTWLLAVGDAIHLVGAAGWLACLVLVTLALRDRRHDDDPAGAAVLVGRFSRFALWSVLALTVAGTTMALPLVRSLGALTSTVYGWTLLAKISLVVAVIAVAAYNRRRLVPAVAAQAAPAGASTDAVPDRLTAHGDHRRAAWDLLQRTMKVELVLLAGVLAITGFLVSIQPAATAAGLAGPTFVTAPFGDGDLEIDLVIDPSEPGTNTVHVYVLEPSGQPSDQLDELRWEFTYLPEGIGPIIVEPFVAGPGHWTATIDDLRFEGPWEVRIVGGMGRFDEVETTVPFSIN